MEFSVPGIQFYDVFAVFKDSKIFERMIKYIVNQYKYDDITHVVGLESNGFCIGVAIALKLKIGFIPIKKTGKLPGDVISVTYTKEHGEDTIEIQQTLDKNAKVIIIDDFIATGNSMRAAVELLNKIGCTIVDCCVLKDILPLKDKPNKIVNGQYTVLF